MEETSYPKMRRPKRQLCYLRSKENPPKQWEGPLTLEDVDRMFDDLDSPSKDDIPSPSSLGQTFCPSSDLHKVAISPIPQEGPHMVPDKEALLPVSRSVSYKLDVDLDIPLTIHGLVKTSSPIEQKTGVSRVENQYNEKAVPEILLYFEDEAPKSTPPPSEKLECNGQVTEESGISELETPPKMFVLPKTTSNKKKPEASQRQVNTECPSVARIEEPTLPTPDNNSKTVHRNAPVETTAHVRNNMTTFLQKLKEAGQSKLACPRKSVIPVKVSIPEPEDDFVILEDDTTFQFSIPSKNAPRKTNKQSRTSSSNKDSSSDKGSGQRQQDQEDLEKRHVKLGSQAVERKTKAKKKEKENSDERPENTKDEMSREQEDPNKNHLKVQSKVNDTAKSQFKDKASTETQPENPLEKTNKHKPYETKTQHSKGSKESIKTTRTKAPKGTRKRLQSSNGNKMDVDVQKQVQEDVDPEELCAPAENHLVEPDTNENATQSKPVAESPGKSSEEGEVLPKRKRKPPGSWWRTDLISLSSEETDSQQTTVKKSKQNRDEPKVAARSPVKEKKEKVFKKRTRKETALSSPRGNKAKAKEMKRNKKRNKSQNTPQKKAETITTTDERQLEEEEVHAEDQDEEESSPLAFNLRDQTISSGGRVFHKVYHHTPNDIISTPLTAPDSHRRPEELLKEAEPTKRRRKPTGSWWIVNNNNNNMADDVETAVSPRRRQPSAVRKSKPPKKREEQPEQDKSPGLSNNSTVDVSSEPAGGAPVPLKLKPLFTPKTVKRSLAKFTDIFATGLETPAGVTHRGTQLKNRRNAASRPAEEKAASDCIIPSTSDPDVPSVDGGEDAGSPGSLHDPHDQQAPQDKCQTESTSHCFRSGPCSMIELEEYEENDLTLPTSRVQALLSPSDLCSLPLKPLVLQSKDKSNLAEWFKSLWSTTAKNDAVITPDQFDWFYYKDKAMGLHVELNAGSICYGKMMLGSQMKKPLWVDHSATTVFHLLTSSVSVTIDGSESFFNPGQSFMVDCGHAYSIHNVTSQPAMLYFTRMSADSSD